LIYLRNGNLLGIFLPLKCLDMAAFAIVTFRNKGYDYDQDVIEFSWDLQVYDANKLHIETVDSFAIQANLSDSPAEIRSKIFQEARSAADGVGVSITTDHIFVVGYVDKGP
jgi:hypothetical protein